jgi:hypothetical protein
MKIRILAAVMATFPFLASCAADQIAPPAQQASALLAVLRQDLSRYQTEYDDVDAAFEANRSAIVMSTNAAASQVSLYQDGLSVQSATKRPDLFNTLQSQGKAYTAAVVAAAPASGPPAPPQLPLDKIDAVIKNLAPLGTPPSRIADADFLLTFASDTNTALNSKSQNATGAAQAPAASPQSPAASP